MTNATKNLLIQLVGLNATTVQQPAMPSTQTQMAMLVIVNQSIIAHYVRRTLSQAVPLTSCMAGHCETGCRL